MPFTINKKLLGAFSLVVVSIYLLSGNIQPCVGEENKKQTTSGDQSPAIITDSGNVIITYGLALESIKALQEFIDSKEKDLEKFKKRLKRIHQETFDSLPEEAEKWASRFIATMPIRKDKLLTQKEVFENEKRDKRLQSKHLEIKIETLFQYVLEIIDNNVFALKNYDTDLTYERVEKCKWFNDQSPKKFVRKITFKNESSFLIILYPGHISNGLIVLVKHFYS